MTQKGRATNTVAFPELHARQVGICLATVLARAKPEGTSNTDFRNQEIAFALAQGQFAHDRVLDMRFFETAWKGVSAEAG